MSDTPTSPPAPAEVDRAAIDTAAMRVSLERDIRAGHKFVPLGIKKFTALLDLIDSLSTENGRLCEENGCIKEIEANVSSDNHPPLLYEYRRAHAMREKAAARAEAAEARAERAEAENNVHRDYAHRVDNVLAVAGVLVVEQEGGTEAAWANTFASLLRLAALAGTAPAQGGRMPSDLDIRTVYRADDSRVRVPVLPEPGTVRVAAPPPDRATEALRKAEAALVYYAGLDISVPDGGKRAYAALANVRAALHAAGEAGRASSADHNDGPEIVATAIEIVIRYAMPQSIEATERRVDAISRALAGRPSPPQQEGEART